MTEERLSALSARLHKLHGPDAAQEALLALLSRKEPPTNPEGFCHRVAWRIRTGRTSTPTDHSYYFYRAPAKYRGDDRERIVMMTEKLTSTLRDDHTPEKRLLDREALDACDPLDVALAWGLHERVPEREGV